MARLEIATEAAGLLDDDSIAAYRRDGYIVVRGFLSPRRVEACLHALGQLASGDLEIRETNFQFEVGAPLDKIAASERVKFIRRYKDFTVDAPVLGAVAHDRRLHAILDQLLGVGRRMGLEMAMVKPPFVGSVKPWHQDAAYFRLADPGTLVGTWIALDPATLANGCMELKVGSHLDGPQPHAHENDLNLCGIPDGAAPPRERVAVEMAPGDLLIFHSCMQHYTAPNTTEMTRRALQFHYIQNGAVWCDAEGHKKVFHDAAGNYTGCTVFHKHLPGGHQEISVPTLRTIVPADWVGG